jgi:hypothetical protein
MTKEPSTSTKYKNKRKELEHDPPPKRRQVVNSVVFIKDGIEDVLIKNEIEDVFGLCEYCLNQIADDGKIVKYCFEESCASFWKQLKFEHRGTILKEKWNFTFTERYRCIHQIVIEFLISPLIQNIGEFIQWSGFHDMVLPFHRMYDIFDLTKPDPDLMRCKIIAMDVNKDDELLLLCSNAKKKESHLFSQRLSHKNPAGWESERLLQHDDLSGMTVDHQSGIVYIYGADFDRVPYSFDIFMLQYAKNRSSDLESSGHYALTQNNQWPLGSIPGVGGCNDMAYGRSDYDFVHDEFLFTWRDRFRIMNGRFKEKVVGIENVGQLPSNCRLRYRKSDGCVGILYGIKLAFDDGRDDSCSFITCTYRFVIVDPNNNDKIMETKEFNLARHRHNINPRKFFEKPLIDFAFDDRKIVFIDCHMIFVVGLKIENSIYAMNLKKSICKRVAISNDLIILSISTKKHFPFCLVYNLSI